MTSPSVRAQRVPPLVRATALSEVSLAAGEICHRLATCHVPRCPIFRAHEILPPGSLERNHYHAEVFRRAPLRAHRQRRDRPSRGQEGRRQGRFPKVKVYDSSVARRGS